MIAEKVYLKPHTIEEALEFAKKYKNSFRFIAGGTDVIVNKFQGNDITDCLIDLTEIDEMKSITIDDNLLKIGALVRLDDLQKNKIIAEKFPALIQAANAVASPMLRKTATIGGNVLCENRCKFYNQTEWWREAAGHCLKCNGNICIATGGKNKCFAKFVSDTATVLISMNALLEIADNAGIKIVPLKDIYTGDGIKPRNLLTESLLKNIILPLDKEYKVVFNKLRPRETVDFTSLTTAVSVSKNQEVKIVIGGVDSRPLIFEAKSSSNFTDILENAVKSSKPVDNDYYSRDYRKEMVLVFLRKSLEELNIIQ
ncbi:MAG: hypothetical protein A2033_17850 [Bacteroidetes bacterium GWA2_31_9]|nr:MAG: hypothetical protein A2033_17850 [Bacteroidetes bacterium GWA2_31_9]